MMKQIIILLFFTILALCACHEVKIGYLKADNADYGAKDSIVVRTVLGDDWNDANREKNNAPWVTGTISGVYGTDPLIYEFVSVKVSEGGNADLFAKEIVVRGAGRMELPLKPLAPKGRYLVTLKVSNKDYSAILPDVFTFIIK